MNVRSVDEYTAISEYLFQNDSNIRRFKTLVSMRTLKSSLSIPIAN
jgi:hypothetical protein